MKNLLKTVGALLLMLLLLASTYSQAQELVGKLYKTKVPIIVKSFYPSERLGISTGWNEKAKFCEAKTGLIFQVIEIKDSAIIIRWWNFDKPSIAVQQEAKEPLTGKDTLEPISFRNTYLDYIITLDDLNSKCIQYYGNDRRFTFGAITMPIKLRFGNKSNRYFSFQESLNVGIAAGVMWQKQGVHEKSTNLLFGLGVSNVALDSLDFKSNDEGRRFQPNVKSTSAITVSAGYVFQFDNFQVGAFTGFDFLPYEIGRQWLHRGKPWIGIGLGFSLFSRNQQTAGTGKNVEAPK